jgi:hypothetical protein
LTGDKVALILPRVGNDADLPSEKEMSQNQFSHYIADDSTYAFKLLTKCGRLLNKDNISAIYFDEKQFSFTKPLCPKCAALRVIAETATSAK